MAKNYCKRCVFYLDRLSEIYGYPVCSAFKEIPKDIWEGKKKHDKPIKGQKGDYVFLDWNDIEIPPVLAD